MAYPFHSEVGEFVEGKAAPAKDVYGLRRYSLDHGAYLLSRYQARRVDHIRPGVGEGFEAPDRIFNVVSPMEEILGSCSQHKWERQTVRGLHCGFDPFQ